MQQIVILDYGMGNVFSLYKKLSILGVNPIISADEQTILQADKLILPGVGSFAKAMQELEQRGLIPILNEAVWNCKKPILGICLGMQLMTLHSEEGDAKGLAWFDAKVKRFQQVDSLRYKVPHVGWNEILQQKDSTLLKGIPDSSAFYFVHSYHVQDAATTDILAQTNYGYDFVSALEKENVFGVQFHPEKSHDVGTRLFENFIAL